MDAARDELAQRLLGHRAWLSALARALVRDAADAEDVVQATWTAALAHPPRGPLRPWLASVARRMAVLLHRGAANRRRREERAARDEALPAADSLVERLELEERLVRELRNLDEPLRTTLVLRYHEGLTAAEIARREGVPEGTVRWRTKRGLDELRERMERACDGREELVLALAPLVRRGGALTGTITGGIMAGKWVLAGVGAIAGIVGARAWMEAGVESAVASPELAGPSEHGADERLGAEIDTAVAADTARREVSPLTSTAVAPARDRLRIVESDGTPLSSALVAWRAAGTDEVTAGRTDEQGSLDSPEGESELFVSRDSAFVHRVSIDPEATPREIVLPEEPVLEGRIVVDGGAPRRPLRLELAPTAGEGLPFPTASEPLEALLAELVTVRTDGAGRFLVRGAREGQGIALRLPPGHVLPGTRGSAVPWRPLRVHVPRAQRGLALEVERAPSIQGRVMEADGRTPTAGLVECRFTWADGTNMHAGARADEDGWFDLFPEAGEEWRTVELAYWGAPGVRGRSYAIFEREHVGADWVLGDLVLAAGRTLELEVVGPDGRPVPEAYTDLHDEPTDEAGRAVLRDVTAEELRVAARGFRELRVAIPAGDDELRVVLESAPELFVSVRDAHGKPVGEVAIELGAGEWPYDAGTPSTLLSMRREGRFHWLRREPFVARYSTDAAGRLRIDSLRPDVPLDLRVLSHGGEVHRERVLPLGDDERRELAIELPIALLELRGRVHDEVGAPISGARIELPAIRSEESAWPRWARTAPDGTFSVQLLDLPDLRVTVTHPEFLPLVRDLARIPVQELELALKRGHSVAVTVLDAEGLPRPDGTLHVEGATIQATTLGRFAVTGLAPGPHEFALRIGGGVFRAVHESHEPELVLRVPSMGAVEVRWEVGPVAEDAFVHVRLRDAAGQSAMSKGFHDMPAGSHRFDPVLPGAYEAIVYRDMEGDEDDVLARGPVTVVADETAVVLLRAAR